MSKKLREAARLAVDALDSDDPTIQTRAALNLRAALAEPEPEQEPVAWYHNGFGTLELSRVQRLGWNPLYTAPPRREWVGLMDEEIEQGNKESWVTEQAWQSAVWWAEAKLKEKNGG